MPLGAPSRDEYDDKDDDHDHDEDYSDDESDSDSELMTNRSNDKLVCFYPIASVSPPHLA